MTSAPIDNRPIDNRDRRTILKGIAATGGLALAAHILPIGAAWAEEEATGAAGMPHGTVNNPLAFVSIAKDGTVTIVCHRSEMGQGVRTGMPMIVADEMEADWSRVRVAQAPGDEAKFTTRTPTARAAPATSSSRCARSAPRPA